MQEIERESTFHVIWEIAATIPNEYIIIHVSIYLSMYIYSLKMKHKHIH